MSEVTSAADKGLPSTEGAEAVMEAEGVISRLMEEFPMVFR